MTYTVTGGLSGSLNGVSFTNAAVTLRTSSDTVNILLRDYGSIKVWYNPGVTTIDIDGFQTATFNGVHSFGVTAQDGWYPGAGIASIADLTTMDSILGVKQTADPHYKLTTAATFTDTPWVVAGTYSTTLGNLITTGYSGNATFTTAAAAIPEPSALALLVLGTIGLATRRRRTA